MNSDPKPEFRDLYVRFPYDDEVIDYVLWKARNHSPNKESLGILIIGQAGTGKSALLKALQRRAIAEFGKGGARQPAPRFTVPSPCTVKAMSIEMRGAMGDPYAAGHAPENLKQMRSLYKLLGVRVFIGDEGHNMGKDEGDLSTSRRKFLKRFMNDLSRVLVMAGTPAFEEMVHADEELSRRFRKTFRMPVYRPGDQDWTRYMGAIDRATGLKESGFGGSELASRICTAVGGCRGKGFDLIHDARDLALRDQADRIELEHLSKAFLDSIARDKPKGLFLNKSDILSSAS